MLSLRVFRLTGCEAIYKTRHSSDAYPCEGNDFFTLLVVVDRFEDAIPKVYADHHRLDGNILYGKEDPDYFVPTAMNVMLVQSVDAGSRRDLDEGSAPAHYRAGCAQGVGEGGAANPELCLRRGTAEKKQSAALQCLAVRYNALRNSAGT